MSPLTDRRLTFNQVALDYDAVRPLYPQAMFDDILVLSRLPEDGQIIEVGCGSGQATLPFARQGYQMLCLDIGPDLLKLAAHKCQAFPQVRFVCDSFEDWQPGEDRFDLLLSATAFHWIPPEVGYPKATRLLKDTGSIALIWNYLPRPFPSFFLDAQEIYSRLLPDWTDPSLGPSLDENIQETETQINQSGLFAPVAVRRYPWSKDYTTAEYLTLLNTYSDHYILDPDVKVPLFKEIGTLIDDKYNGRITKPNLTALFIAPKK
jgi:SAM-dependent methyltransferase